MSRWPQSVRLRLTLWYAAALTSIILAFSLGVYFFERTALLKAVDRRLDEEIEVIEKVLSEEPDEISELEEYGAVGLFCVTAGERIVHRSMAWGRAGLGPDLDHARPGPFGSWTARDAEAYFVRTRDLHAGEDVYRVHTALNGRIVIDSLRALAGTLVAGFLGAIALAGAGGFLLAGRLLAPVSAMAARAQRITAERLAERLPVRNARDEFGRLATAFNDTLARLEDAFENLRRFTADASHELRTPLTALRSVGEVAVHGDRDPESYRDVIGSMLEEVDRLSRLVDSLLTLTRADSGRARLHPEPVALEAVAREAADCLHVLAEDKGQALAVEAEGSVAIEADRSILRQALMNVLDNAIKYTPHRGRVRVVVRRDGAGRALCEVQDSGPGIPPGIRDKIFHRFFRGAKERAGGPRGAGLGLAIARWAVESHGGTIEVDGKAGGGSTFRIVLPAAGSGPDPG